MPVNKAKKHFLGKEGHEKLNCAAAIIKAFTELDPKAKDLICKGGGKSPNDECGALCAAREIIKKQRSIWLPSFNPVFLLTVTTKI
ncbi:MAG: hypothetical protein KJ732_03775 [Candidatus Margulisbacteria bacterium]|nr:hypothetical protein [Candidatus Margulisiibacteriota bacterium]